MTVIPVPETVKGSEKVARAPAPARRRDWTDTKRLLKKTDYCSQLVEDDGSTTRDVALARCDCLMARYLAWKHENMWKSTWSQRVALWLGAITPVLILVNWGTDNAYWTKIIAAIAAAGAAILTGMLTQSGWRENYIRYGHAWHALQGEKYKYLTHAVKEYATGDDEKDARNFASRIEEIAMWDVSEWLHWAENRNDRGDSNGKPATINHRDDPSLI